MTDTVHVNASNGRGDDLNEKIRELVLFAYERAPAVRKRFDRAGVSPGHVRTTHELTRLPALTKEEIIECQQIDPPLGGFLTIPAEELGWIFVSPGPVYVPLPEIETARIVFSNQGFKEGDTVLNCFSYHLAIAGILFDGALRSLGVTVIPGGVGNTDLQAHILQSLGVTGYVGTPSFLITLIERAQALGLDLGKDLKLRHASVTGEMLPAALRSRLQDDYNIKTSQYYGVAEIGTVAFECAEQDGMHINDQGVVVEIVDPETGEQLGPGEVGEVVVTSFNRTFPLIRFRTGDLSSYFDEPCECGISSHRLAGIEGRIGQAAKVRGMFLHPAQLVEAAARIPQIGKVQGVITRTGARDELRLKAELMVSDSDEHHEEILAEELRGSVRELCRLRADDIEFVSPGSMKEGDPAIVDKRSW